jgi:hypothetical protein
MKDETENRSVIPFQGGGSLSPLQSNPDIARAIAEVQGMIVVAKSCPRDEATAFRNAVRACERPGLAEQSQYSYPRGGMTVNGPTIRLLETIALHWGNIKYGVNELSSDENETKYEAYAWDMQNNIKTTRVFTQKHGRWTKNNGFKAVDDPRDIYEVVMSTAMRRVRACLQEVVPADLVEACEEQCNKTMEGNTQEPLLDRVRKMFKFFEDNLQVTEKMIVKKLNHKIEATSETELINLRKIYKSMI